MSDSLYSAGVTSRPVPQVNCRAANAVALLSAVVYLRFVLRRTGRSRPRHMLGAVVPVRSSGSSFSDHH